jgi:pyrroloquinoline quinone (PQQ) biosynthesis protein C
LCESDVAAIAGLLAYETQGAEIARSKAEGLRRYYGADGTATSFWDAHSTLEEDHARWTLDALASLDASDDEIFRAARAVATAWWEFLSEREALVAA